jgi:hypothetical protein
LKNDLMSLLFESLTCEPRAVSLGPMLAGLITAAMPKQKCKKLLPRAHELHRCVDACAGEIAHGFVRFVRDPDTG